MTATSDAVYVGGKFDYAARVTGNNIIYDDATGSVIRGFKEYFSVASDWVFPDGTGGLYLLSNNDFVIDGHNYGKCLHVDQQGLLDISPPFDIISLQGAGYDGTSLYILGSVRVSSTVTLSGLNKFNAQTGANISSFSAPGITCSSVVVDFEFDGAGSLYLSGETFFIDPGSVDHGHIIKIEAATGNLDTAFNPGTGTSYSGPIYMSKYNNGNLYIAGDFYTINGYPREKFAKIDALTGSIDTAFVADLSGGAVNDFLISNGYVYICGFFNTINGTLANGFSRISAATGTLDTSFNPGSSGQINHGLCTQGSNILLSQIGVIKKYRLSDGMYLAGQDIDVCGVAYSIAAFGDKVFMGGEVICVNGVEANNLIKLSVTGEIIDTGFTPNIYDSIDPAVVNMDYDVNGLFIAGNFNRIDSFSRINLGKVDRYTGRCITTFDPPFPSQNTGEIICSGGSLYSCTYLMSERSKINSVTGVLDPGFVTNGSGLCSPEQLCLLDDVMYVKRHNCVYNGVLYTSYITKINAITGVVDAGFNFDFINLDNIHDFYPFQNNIFVALQYYGSGGPGGSTIVKLNHLTGIMDSTFNFNTGGIFNHIMASGNQLYCAGLFTNGAVTTNILKFDSVSGAADYSLVPNVHSTPVVFNEFSRIAISPDGNILYGISLFDPYLGSHFVSVLIGTSTFPVYSPSFTVTPTQTSAINYTLTPTMTVTAGVNSYTPTPTCTATPTMTETPEAGQENNMQNIILAVYPNPANNVILMSFDHVNKDESIKLKLYTNSFRLIRNTEIKCTGDSLMSSMDVSSVANGTYIILIEIRRDSKLIRREVRPIVIIKRSGK